MHLLRKMHLVSIIRFKAMIVADVIVRGDFSF